MTAPPHTSPDGHMVYGKCYASYVRSVSDTEADPDAYPDVALLEGTAKFEAVFDGTAARGALPLPALPRTKGIVVSGDTYNVKNSNLVDRQNREGVWLVVSINGIPITWRVTITLNDERNRTVLSASYIVTDDLWQIDVDGDRSINLPDYIPNPGALTPQEGTALRSAQQTLAEIVTLKGLIDISQTSASDSAAAALHSRNQALTYRNAAEGHATNAGTSATNASNSATAAGTSATNANNSRIAAENAKNSVDTAKTQIDTTHDHIHQDVTHADTHALAAGESATTAINKALEALNSAGTASTKATEASQSAANALSYRNTANTASSNATTKAAEAAASATTAGTHATTATTKASEAAANALTLAQRVETGTKELGVTSDGRLYFLDQAEVGVPLTVDNTVGTRVMLGNVPILQDTGWRRLSDSDFINGWSAGSVRPWIRRLGDLVYMNIPSVGLTGAGATDTRFFTFPTGFKPIYNYSVLGAVEQNVGGTLTVRAVKQDMSFALVTAGGSISGMLIWRTAEPWPTSLPGTAS